MLGLLIFFFFFFFFFFGNVINVKISTTKLPLRHVPPIFLIFLKCIYLPLSKYYKGICSARMVPISQSAHLLYKQQDLFIMIHRFYFVLYSAFKECFVSGSYNHLVFAEKALYGDCRWLEFFVFASKRMCFTSRILALVYIKRRPSTYMFYIFHLSSLSNVLSFGKRLNMTEILWFRLLNTIGSCQLLPRT